jgi:hypothetical protein
MSAPRTASTDELLKQIDDFFMKKDPVHRTLSELARRLGEEQIDYAVIGGMALALHGMVRPTLDVDVLMSSDGLRRFHAQLVGRGYVPSFPGARKHFRDADTGVKVEVITSGEYPGDGKPKPIAFPDPAVSSVLMEGIRVVRLETLVELKLASGLTAEHRRLRDLGDVQRIIETLDLPREMAGRLDATVQDEYLRLWSLAQTARGEERS